MNVAMLSWLMRFWYAAALLAFGYCAYVDWRTRRIPNRVTYPFLAGSLLLTWIAGQWPMALWGGLLAGGVLLVPRLIAGPTKAGMGDVKLSALGGLLVGPQGAIYALLVAFGAALLLLLPLLWTKRLRWQQAVPFGPYLALGFGLFLCLLIMAR
ncbi:MAG: A24 family peptidase [Caldilineaceae bacterium]